MFKQMKVATRLTLGFLAVVVLGAIVAGIAIYNMTQMNERAKRMYQKELMGIAYVKEADLDQVSLGRSLRGAMLASTEDQRATMLANADKYKQQLQDNLDKARPLFHSDEGKRIFAETDAQLRDFDGMVADLVKRVKAEPLAPKRDSVDYLFGTLLPKSQALDAKMADLSHNKEAMAHETNQSNKSAY
jgi:methyl-accepting chemotaxis protein